jgi:hypothetical protein
MLQMCNTIIRRAVHATTLATQRTSHLSSSDHSHCSYTQPHDPQLGSSPGGTVAPGPYPAPSGAKPTTAEPRPASGTTTRTAQLFALAEQCDLQGLEVAIGGIPSGSTPPQPLQPASATSPSMSTAHNAVDATGAVAPAAPAPTERVLQLDVLEADVVVMLSALCRLAARQAGDVGDDTAPYIIAGKRLAAELLLQVLESPANPWLSLSGATWSTLRQPFCMVALRSAGSDTEVALTSAPRLFVALLSKTPLRFSLKAEMGAFFPLLLLKTLEMESPSLAMLTACLDASATLAGEAQLMVDLFVNYDCDLQVRSGPVYCSACMILFIGI